ncbi:MAG: hypothetical protein LAN37_09730 [Acidobacteriia bacterium]|nr:hypothetical protein [Terriglobia bacterium]
MAKSQNSFDRWIPMYRLCIADLPNYGNVPAVYAIRHCTTREILKYGHTQHLRQRIVMNFLCGWGGATTHRVFLELYDNEMVECVEVAWIQAKSKAEAQRMEGQFRRAYMEVHGGQRPPWDRQN